MANGNLTRTWLLLLLVIVTGNISTANEGLSGRQLHCDGNNIDCKQPLSRFCSPFSLMPDGLIKYLYLFYFVSVFESVFVSVLLCICTCICICKQAIVKMAFRVEPQREGAQASHPKSQKIIPPPLVRGRWLDATCQYINFLLKL